MAFLLERDYGIKLPRRLQIEFSRVIQQITDQTGGEVTSAESGARSTRNMSGSNSRSRSAIIRDNRSRGYRYPDDNSE